MGQRTGAASEGDKTVGQWCFLHILNDAGPLFPASVSSEGQQGGPGRCGLQSEAQPGSRTPFLFPRINSYHLRQCFCEYGPWTACKRTALQNVFVPSLLLPY